jgi:hypothetical protein
MSDTQVVGDSTDLREAFPVVDPGAVPLGARILVQMRLPKKKNDVIRHHFSRRN